MINICTLCDNNYLLKGLALYNSLNETIENKKFILHWLCLDDIIYHNLKKINYDNVILYKLSEFELNDIELQNCKNNPLSLHARSQREQYIWSLTPYFINYILKNKILKEQYLFYCDSDIYFYKSPQLILDVINNKSVGIHTHRFGGSYNQNINTGWFNVGVVVFKNDIVGLDVSEHWKFWCLSTKHEYYKFYGTCGDQKYLELFIKLWSKKNDICIFDEENNFSIGHLAAWNSDNLQHIYPNKIVYKNVVQNVIFFHFSHFTCDLQKNQNEYKDSWHGEWKPTKDINIKKYYDQYFQEIKKAYSLLN